MKIASNSLVAIEIGEFDFEMASGDGDRFPLRITIVNVAQSGAVGDNWDKEPIEKTQSCCAFVKSRKCVDQLVLLSWFRDKYVDNGCYSLSFLILHDSK